MSSKTRTRKTRNSTASMTGSDRTLRSVPEPTTGPTNITKARTEAEDSLWVALYDQPKSTAAELSTAAGIGKSTAAKILARWAGDGSVTRTAGIVEGGRRAADLWAITDVDTDQAETTAAPPDTAQADPDAADTGDAKPVGGDSAESIDTAADDTQDPADAGETQSATAEPVAEATEPAVADTAEGGEKAARLAPGALRGMVEDFLRNNPGKEFGPTAIARALVGKSSGAVSNALDKLVENKTAVRTKDSPRRFALSPAEADAAPTPTPTS